MPRSNFNFFSTAQQVVDGLGVSLTGKTAVVTGGNSGIGAETVKVLAMAGCHVVLASRTLEAGKTVAEAILADPACKGSVVVMQLDLADSASIRKFAQDVLATEKHIDYLILNAGTAPFRHTAPWSLFALHKCYSM
eukprot:jgi/Botrbrau1/1709/Bobra.116_2s0051.1